MIETPTFTQMARVPHEDKCMYDQEEWREREQLDEHRVYLEANPVAGFAESAGLGGDDGIQPIILRVVLFGDIERRAGLPVKGRKVRAFWRDMDLHGFSSIENLRETLDWMAETGYEKDPFRSELAKKLLAALDGLDPDSVVLFDHSPWADETRNLRDFDLSLASRVPN